MKNLSLNTIGNIVAVAAVVVLAVAVIVAVSILSPDTLKF